MLSLRRLLFLTTLLSGVHCAVDDSNRSVTHLTPVRPFKGQRARPREKIIRGLLNTRQDLSCDPGYGLCPNLPGICCIVGEECCSGGGCCAIGEYCVANGCCPDGETCTTRTKPIGAIAGGSVGGVILLAVGIFLCIRRRRRNRTPPLPVPASGTGALVTPTPTPTPADQKHAPESLYSSSPGKQVVSELPSSAVVMSVKSGGGYSLHDVVHAPPSYPTTILPTVPSNVHYSEPQVVYAGLTTISSTGGTQSTTSWRT
ncbi:hypothetical protein C8R45DRAFT_929331 [Mycena sanguinolenta]|nr:hypothetical protein C8R45DRAFT_929331 [Mycena sanguinolenta]